jgi:hypothetical protein
MVQMLLQRQVEPCRLWVALGLLRVYFAADTSSGSVDVTDATRSTIEIRVPSQFVVALVWN